MKHGYELNIYFGYTKLASATDNDVNISQNMIDACEPNSGRTNIKIPTTYEWSASANCLVSSWEDVKKMMNYVINGTKLAVYLKMGEISYGGEAYVSSVRPAGSAKGLAKMSISITGSGPLEIKPIPPEPKPMEE